MAQIPCIGLCKPCISLPFGDCAMYVDHGQTSPYIIFKSEKKRRKYVFLGVTPLKKNMTMENKHLKMYLPLKW